MKTRASNSSSPSERIRATRDIVGILSANEGEPGFVEKLRIIWIWGIGTWLDFDHVTVNTEINLNRILFESQIEDCSAAIKEHASYLQAHSSVDLVREIHTKSKLLFKAKLYDLYSSRLTTSRKFFDNPRKDPSEFRAEYPVITSTTDAAR